jgi:hypothetical protein
MTGKDHLCLKKVYPVRRSECIPKKKQRLPRLPTASTAKKGARRAKPMSTGFVRSERCVEGLLCAPQVRRWKLLPRLLGPRIPLWKSKFPRVVLRNGSRAASDSARKDARAPTRPRKRVLANPIYERVGRKRALSLHSSAAAGSTCSRTNGLSRRTCPTAQRGGGVGWFNPEGAAKKRAHAAYAAH